MSPRVGAAAPYPSGSDSETACDSVNLQRIRLGLGVWNLKMLSLLGVQLGVEMWQLGRRNGEMEDKEDRARSLGAIADVGCQL